LLQISKDEQKTLKHLLCAILKIATMQKYELMKIARDSYGERWKLQG
jgi:DNA-binding PadR family transcriptional regulator